MAQQFYCSHAYGACAGMGGGVDTEGEDGTNATEDDNNVFEEEEEIPLLKSILDTATQVNLADTRTSRPNGEGISLANILSDSFSQEKCTQVNFLPPWNDEDHSQPAPSITLPTLLSTKEKLFTFTGLHSLELLDCLAQCVAEIALDAQSKKKLLTVKDRIILTMVKIKQNMDFTALGVLFGINRQTCSNYFKNMCPLLARVLKVVIPWPDQSLIRCNLPLSFDKFRSTKIVLDCCEVTIEKCKCLKCRVLTYSQYKKNHTVKFNMGVAPSGLITEASSAYGGRASDKHIVADSGILNKLDYGDAVMVDKGYQIEKECLERNLKLFRPPFLSQKKQLSREDALSGAEIARARVHVERVFQRIREYDLLCGPVPWPLAPYFEDVLTIVMGLTNLGPPVMNIDKFMSVCHASAKI
ncbi:hypothetical protein FOCC_FOCC014274 [Frankliniella occidentalis]|nr:hypothetical protein FOCC_FOCC014274 [Frankliniella occidentalis]